MTLTAVAPNIIYHLVCRAQRHSAATSLSTHSAPVGMLGPAVCDDCRRWHCGCSPNCLLAFGLRTSVAVHAPVGTAAGAFAAVFVALFSWHSVRGRRCCCSRRLSAAAFPYSALLACYILYCPAQHLLCCCLPKRQQGCPPSRHGYDVEGLMDGCPPFP
jgi:hypothetical protein